MALLSILTFALGGLEIALILGVIIFFFGAKRIPELAKGLGRSITEFKKGKNEQPGSDPPSDKGV